jgi:Outer membrane protein beta-barrel domain
MRGTRSSGWRLEPVFAGLAVALAAVFAPAASKAEAFFDIYAGVGFPEKSDIDTDADDPFVDGDIAYHDDVDWDDTPSIGMRGGYWFEFENITPSFIGAALDLSYYRAFEDSNFAELNVWLTPLTPLLMLRLPLGYSEDYPGGRVQPYIAVGPGFTLAAADANLSEIPPTADLQYEDFEAAGFGVGFDGRAGLAIQLGHHFALFSEYRYTYVKPHFQDHIDVVTTSGFVFDTDVDFDPEIRTHHVVFGASFRF